jgi:uncharacterized protein YigE (DUF2233 family)
MFKNSFLIIIACLFINRLSAQGLVYQNIPYDSTMYDAYVIKIEKNGLKGFDIINNQAKLSYSAIEQKLPKDSVFLINATITDDYCKPLGLFIKDKQELNPVNTNTSGSGNFYLMPNGALLISDENADICQTKDINVFQGKVKVGLQSGPMLVINKQLNSNFNAGSQNKNIRCGVGIFATGNEKYLVFAIARTPVNFYSFSMFFLKKYNCSNALCLGGGSCIMHCPFIDNSANPGSAIICQYLYCHIP